MSGAVAACRVPHAAFPCALRATGSTHIVNCAGTRHCPRGSKRQRLGWSVASNLESYRIKACGCRFGDARARAPHSRIMSVVEASDICTHLLGPAGLLVAELVAGHSTDDKTLAKLLLGACCRSWRHRRRPRMANLDKSILHLDSMDHDRRPLDRLDLSILPLPHVFMVCLQLWGH